MAAVTYTFGGTLVLVDPLHIGSGRGGGTLDTDATVVTNAAGQPYIPGSSVRGALRAAVGRFGAMLYISEIRDDAVIRASVENVVPEDSPLSEKEIQQKLSDPQVLSSAERLFGTTFWESPLKIPDLHVVEGAEREVRDGVGIDRDTGAAHDGAKYDFEVLARGAKFNFLATLDTTHAPDAYVAEWLQLMAIALRLLETGELRLGGRHARGIGRVRLDDLTVHALDLDDPDQLLAALTQEQEPTGMGRGIPQDAGWPTRMLQELA